MNVIKGINHITLAVTDLNKSVQFYMDGLGLKLIKIWDKGAYLEAGDDWICLSPDENAKDRQTTDYTHIAFDIEQKNFEFMCNHLIKQGVKKWKDNKSEGDSFYFLDPDNHKLEIHVGTLQTRLEFMQKNNR